MFEIHPETQTLYDHITAMGIGHITSYAILNRLVDGDVRKTSSHEDGKYDRLYAARRKARNQNFMAFKMIPGVGIKRLEDVEIVNAGFKRMNNLRRQSRIGINTIKCIESRSDLPHNVKIECGAVATMLMVENRLALAKRIRKVETAVIDDKPLTFKQALRLFVERNR